MAQVARSGRLSWFGGPRDRSDSGRTALGLTTAVPGVAIRPGATYESGRPYLGGYWRVQLPNGRSVIVRQTDIGPNQSTGRRVDFTYSALRAAGYNESNFPTDATARFFWLGKDKNKALNALAHPNTVYVDEKGRVFRAPKSNPGAVRSSSSRSRGQTAGGVASATDQGPGISAQVAALYKTYLQNRQPVQPQISSFASQPNPDPLGSLGYRPQQVNDFGTGGLLAQASVGQPRSDGLADLLAGLASLTGSQGLPSSPQRASTPGSARPTSRSPSRGRTPALRGRVSIAPGADRGGVGTHQRVTAFLNDVSAIAGVPIRVTTGTNHNRLTTTGNVSDHWSGNGADIAVPWMSAQGDKIAAAALVRVGVPKAQAIRMARHGGLWTYQDPKTKRRVQIIWKVTGAANGGEHRNHVHIGVR